MFANLSSQVRNANHFNIFNDADLRDSLCPFLGHLGGLGEGFGLVGGLEAWRESMGIRHSPIGPRCPKVAEMDPEDINDATDATDATGMRPLWDVGSKSATSLFTQLIRIVSEFETSCRSSFPMPRKRQTGQIRKQWFAVGLPEQF